MKRLADNRKRCLICKAKSWEKICPLCRITHPGIDSRQLERKRAYAKRRRVANLAIAHPALRLTVFARDNYRCQKCGSIENLTVHHVVSVYMGGSNDLDNLTTYCRRCNSATNPD